MKLLWSGRRAGKTTKAILLAHETGAYLIVINREEALRVSKLADAMDKPIRFPVTIEEFLHGGMKGSYVRNLVIDNADEIFNRIFDGFEIEMITFTGEKYESQ